MKWSRCCEYCYRCYMVFTIIACLVGSVWFLWRGRGRPDVEVYRILSALVFFGALDVSVLLWLCDRKPPFPKNEDFRIVRRGRSGNVYVPQKRVLWNLWRNLGVCGDWCHAEVEAAHIVIASEKERMCKAASDAIPKVKVRHRGEKGHECWLSDSSCGGHHMSGNPAHATVFTYADYGFDSVSKDPREWVKRWAAYQDLPMEVINVKTGKVIDTFKP